MNSYQHLQVSLSLVCISQTVPINSQLWANPPLHFILPSHVPLEKGKKQTWSNLIVHLTFYLFIFTIYLLFILFFYCVQHRQNYLKSIHFHLRNFTCCDSLLLNQSGFASQRVKIRLYQKQLSYKVKQGPFISDGE